MSIWLKAFYILTWVFWTTFLIITFFLGLFIVPIGLMSEHWPRIIKFWDNIEDDPRYNEHMKWWYKKARSSKNPFLRLFPNWWWFAIRNSSNGIRWWFEDRKCSYDGNWIEQDMHANEIQDAGLTVGKRWGWNGWFAFFEYVKINDDNTSTEFWYGWKLDHKTPGLGFAQQFKWKQKISDKHGGEIS
jgi:hypothetical protein